MSQRVSLLQKCVIPKTTTERWGLSCDLMATLWSRCCCSSTGFNPRWDCTFNFTVHVPDLALVRFMVEDHDYASNNDFLGQYTLPFTSLRTGVCPPQAKQAWSLRFRVFHLPAHLFRLPPCPSDEDGRL